MENTEKATGKAKGSTKASAKVSPEIIDEVQTVTPEVDNTVDFISAANASHESPIEVISGEAVMEARMQTQAEAKAEAKAKAETKDTAKATPQETTFNVVKAYFANWAKAQYQSAIGYAKHNCIAISLGFILALGLVAYPLHLSYSSALNRAHGTVTAQADQISSLNQTNARLVAQVTPAANLAPTESPRRWYQFWRSNTPANTSSETEG